MFRQLGLAVGLVISLFRCNSPVIVPGHAGTGGAGAPAAGAPAAGMPALPTPPKPLVTLITDTSGSMAWLPGCVCSTLGCTECLPNCEQGQRNRWHEVLAALTGSFIDFACTQTERTAANGATYDVGYNKPFYPLTPGVTQRADGVLDRYRDRVAFGVATFDGASAYLGAPPLVSVANFNAALSNGVEGEYSYAGMTAVGPRLRPDGSVVGKIRYPSTTADYMMDTGLVGPDAADGALLLADATTDPSARVASIKRSLHGVRPFGGTPIAAALDDLYFAYTQPSAAGTALGAKRYAILISDGYPDDDFRVYPAPGCNCGVEGTCPPQDDPLLMSCPYPTAADAALHLRCGFESGACQGPLTKLFVIGLSLSLDVRPYLESLAASGGTEALFAGTQAELRSALDDVFAQILSATN